MEENPQPNLPLLRKVWEKVSEIPTAREALDDYCTRTGSRPGSWAQVFKELGVSEVWDQSSWGDAWSCGSVACFAGWAVLIHDGTLRDYCVEQRAVEVLGLYDHEAGMLFSANNTRDDLERGLSVVFERAGERFDG